MTHYHLYDYIENEFTLRRGYESCLKLFHLELRAMRPCLRCSQHQRTCYGQEWYEMYGEKVSSSTVIRHGAVAGTPGTLWDNGAFDSVNGFTSEANTAVSGTGGPEGDHGSTIADDFVVTTTSTLTEIRVCFLSTVTSAELYIYADNGGVPGPSVTAPVFGGPTTASVVTSTFNDNTSRCPGAYGYPGREYMFNATTTGVTLPTLSPGRYWLAVVGRGSGSGRAFWATSTNNASAGALAFSAVIGSSYFGFAYWTPTIITQDASMRSFAFDIDGVAGGSSVTSIPTMSEWGMIIFMVLAGLGSVYYLSKQRRVRN